MSEPDWAVEADPKRPYKSYAAIAIAMLTTLLTFSNVIPLWLLILVNMILSGLAVFVVGNPMRVKPFNTREGRPVGNQDTPLWD